MCVFLTLEMTQRNFKFQVQGRRQMMAMMRPVTISYATLFRSEKVLTNQPFFPMFSYFFSVGDARELCWKYSRSYVTVRAHLEIRFLKDS